MSRGRLCAVIGGQYGSEGKGTIVARIADKFQVHVRVGSHNAGHSFRIADNVLGENLRTWKMQQIPVGWINPKAMIVIGRGALISPETLLRELTEIAEVDPDIWNRVIVDSMAGVLNIFHHDAEGGTRGELHNRIGSTGEGVGAARIARLKRDPEEFYHFKDLVKMDQWKELAHLSVGNTSFIINEALKAGQNVLLEGSQGVHLSITHGPWPFVTTTDCGAAQLCADVGVPPMWLTDVLCVLRTFPIRVAGHSGPLRNEITWEALSERLGKGVSERTTVTKKIRRIGAWDEELVRTSIELNAPTSLALNFVDYLDLANEGVDEWHKLTPTTRQIIRDLEKRYGIPVDFIGTGGPGWTVIANRTF